MKRIMVFEAFKTDKLNKTLSFIDPVYRKKFREDLESVGNHYDFPISNFDDSMFQYLPYQKAIKLINYPEAGKCDFQGEYMYNDNGIHIGIPGKSCEKGKIERKWGSAGRTRIVDCPRCHGTGKKSPTDDPRYLKFWFSSDGKYAGTTITNGLKQGDSSQFSREIKDYNIIKEYPSGAAMRREVRTGDIVLANIFRNVPGWYRNSYSDPTGDMIGVIVKVGNHVYFVQDTVSVRNVRTWDFPRDFNWRAFGRWPYKITERSSYTGNIKLLGIKDSSSDPLLWNHAFNISNFRKNTNPVNEILNEANFAIVLDLKILEKTVRSDDFEKASKIRNDRTESKIGSTHFMDNESIKNANINRYLKSISSNVDINLEELSNLNTIFRRMLGFKNIVLLKTMRGSRDTDTIKNIAKSIYSIMVGDNVEDNILNINKTIKNTYNEVYGSLQTRDAKIKELKSQNGYTEQMGEVLDLMDKMGEAANSALKKIKTENISDILIFQLKASTMCIGKYPEVSKAMSGLSRISGWGISYTIRDLSNINMERFRKEVELQIDYINRV